MDGVMVDVFVTELHGNGQNGKFHVMDIVPQFKK